MAKRIIKITGIVILCIIAAFTLLVLTHMKAARMVFWNLVSPKVNIDTESEWKDGKTYLKIPYSAVSASDYLDLYVPSGTEKPPLYVVVHGGGFILNDSQSRQAQLMYHYFRDKGFAVASINYRLADEAPYPGCIEDAKASIRFLRANAEKYGYDAQRIAIFGESAGGYLACMAAFTNDDEFNGVSFIGEDQGNPVSGKVQVLINYYGAVSLNRNSEDFRENGLPDIIVKIANSWLSGDKLHGYSDCESYLMRKEWSDMTDEEKNLSSPLYYAEKNLTKDSDLHVYTSHGNCDMTVPIQQSYRLKDTLDKTLGSDKNVLHIVDRAGHAGERMFTDKELSEVLKYMNEYIDN